MNQFIQRVANYVANEIIIKGLANSKTFQRFAVRADARLRDLHKKGTETFTSAFEEINAQQAKAESVAAQGPPKPPPRGFPGFVRAFVKEIQKDLGIG